MKVRKSAHDRKAEIVQAALDLAFEVGPERVTTGKIADHLGLTQPAIYKHFRSKEDVWRAVAEKLRDRIAENIARATSADQGPVDRLRQLVLGHLRLVQETPALPEIMVARGPKGARSVVQSHVQPSMSDFQNAIVSTIREARSDKIFRPDINATDLAALILGIIQSLVLRLLVTRDPKILLRDGKRLLELQLSVFIEPGVQA